MDKPSFKLVGGPCGQHGQYTFYKALRITGEKERIIAIGDFFFVRIWQDSELVSIGELQLLWTDRVSDQTLVSLRLYFLPENTPDGRNQHGQDEVLAINDKVVLKAEDLLSWVCCGEDWHWGLRAVWRGACAPPANPRRSQPLHHTRLDFSDVEREKNAINEDADSPGVVVFSYPRYCRYRALLSRLEGIQGDWLRDSLVAALGGYAAPTKNTRILYCKDTFEYPELEGHEFVCNQLAPKLKGRPRGRRRRRADRLEPEHEPGPGGDDPRSSDSDDHKRPEPKQRPRRLSLRNGAPKYSDEETDKEQPGEDRAFLQQLKQFYRSRREPFKLAHSLKDREYPEPYTPEYSDEETDKEQPGEDRAFLQQLKQFYRSRREPFKLAHSLKDREYPEPYTPEYSDEETDKEQPGEDRAFLQQLKQFYRSRREPFKLAHSLKDREYPEPYTPEYSDEETDKEQPGEDRAFLQQLKQFYRSRREPFKLAHSLKDREYPEPYTPEYSDEETDKEQPGEDRAFLQQLKQFYRSRREPFKLAHSLKDREYPEPYTPEYSDEETDKEQPGEDRAFLQQLKQFYRSRREPFKLAHSLKDREYPEPYTPEYSDEETDKEQPGEDRAFLQQLKQFYRSRREPFKLAHSLKDLSLRSLYQSVTAAGGYEAACRHRLWRRIHAPQPNTARRHYERVLLPLEKHEVSRGALTLPRLNGAAAHAHTPAHAHGPAHAHNPAHAHAHAPRTIATIELPDSREPSPAPDHKDDVRDFSVTSKPAEELNREFLESLPKEESKLKISVKPVEKLLEESKKEKEEPREGAFYSELAQKLKLGDHSKFLSDSSPQPGLVTSSALSSLSSLVNGHAPPKEQSRPPTRSSLRAVRVKPARAQLAAPPSTPPIPLLRPDSASSSPPAGSTPSAPAAAAVTNFGIHHPPPPAHSDDDIVEVPYKPKTPEIIDLDEYPESPQAIKRKKLDILKERGLEVTAIPSAPPAAAAGCWPPAAPLAPLAVQHQLLTQAQLFQMYNIVHPAYANGVPPPKVIQATSAFGSCGPEKTVYGNPKDPFMPPPHVLTGAPLKPQRNSSSSAPLAATPPQDILDLTCKGLQPPSQTQKPAVEIVRIPSVPSPSKLTTAAQSLAKNYTLVDGKAVVGSNLEITLVNPKSQTPTKSRQQQKRSSNGKFVGAKTPTPPKDYPKSYISPSPSGVKKPPIIVPNYQVNQRDDISPTSSTGSGNSQTNLQNNLLQNAFKGPSSLQQMMDMQKNVPSMPYVDPMYMSALYSSLAGGMDQRQLAMYRDFMANQFRGYSGLLGVTPTTKN